MLLLLLVASCLAAQSEHQMDGIAGLDVVEVDLLLVSERLAAKDEALLFGRNALLLLDALLETNDRIAGLDVERDQNAAEVLDLDLHCGGGREEEWREGEREGEVREYERRGGRRRTRGGRRANIR